MPSALHGSIKSLLDLIQIDTFNDTAASQIRSCGCTALIDLIVTGFIFNLSSLSRLSRQTTDLFSCLKAIAASSQATDDVVADLVKLDSRAGQMSPKHEIQKFGQLDIGRYD
ncbi:RNA-directed RNA polymerase [Pseudozyma hubeiensis SY62]|uniref:RNA-directed RNA polymerase n=1 Tax=Pseudozyma hubeiensis (strain SY62) TaxID=1305764 RepID=R9P4R1_PSEHS|nr:RNA-directed RNA polymerase [Pseudozyma hubeiensis SY62]GAC93100.1 RNA-directed RNA polymerase [Pseudozyma hubeiensis SY62]